MADCAETTALNGIQGIGEILENAAIGCGGSECTPFMEQLPPTESLASLGSLLEDLAGVAKLCSDHRVSLAKEQTRKLETF